MASRPMTQAQLRNRVRSACEGARKAGLHVHGVEIGDGGIVRLVTSDGDIDAPSQPVPSSEPCGLDKWASTNVVSIEGRS